MGNFLKVNAIISDGKKVRIPLIQTVVDGYTGEEHLIGTQKSSIPIEDGSEITDHATVKPSQLTVTGIVTDEISPSRPQKAWDTLRSINTAATPVIVHTLFGTYDEMIITNVRAKRIGNNMSFEMNLGSIIRASLQILTVSENAKGPAERRGDEVKRGRIVPRVLLQETS